MATEISKPDPQALEPAPVRVPSASARLKGRPTQRPRSRWFGRLVQGGLLLGLLAATAWNASWSPMLIRARQAEGKGDVHDALLGALEHLRWRPWSREAAGIAARSLSRLDFAKQAEPYYERAGSLSHEDRHYRAYGLVRANLREDAVAAYQEILRNEPTDASALRLLGGVYLSQARWNELRAVAERLIALPDRPTSGFALSSATGFWSLRKESIVSPVVIGQTLKALAHHDLREYEEAVGAFDEVLALDPRLQVMPLPRNLFWAHYSEDLMKVGRSVDAIKALEPIADASKDVGLIDLLARAYLQESRLKDAQAAWMRVLAINPREFTALLQLGRMELQASKPQEAVALLEQAIQVAPDSYEANYSLGQAFRRLNRLDDARRYGDRAAEIDKNRKVKADETRERP